VPCTSPRLAHPFVWYRCAQFHGVGILQRPAGASSDTDAFSGEFSGGAEHGVGVLKTAAGTYKGQFAHGQRNGCGLEVSSKTGQQFMGNFVKDERHGLALIQARGQKSGQVVLERWEHGVRTGEGASVTREYVGGAADAAAHLAAAAFQALAGVAENKADLARECSAADENTPPPPLAALGLKLNRVHKHIDHAAYVPAAGREGVSDSVRSGSLVEQKLELAKTLEDGRNALLCKELSASRSENKLLREHVLALEATVREAELARANSTKELLRVRTQSEALIEAQEEHLIAVRKQYALEHERRLEEASARSERELQMLEREIKYLKNRKEPSSAAQSNKDKGMDSKTETETDSLRFSVVPIGGRIMSESEKRLDDVQLLTGPRKMATFGGLLTWGVHAYVLKVHTHTQTRYTHTHTNTHTHTHTHTHTNTIISRSRSKGCMASSMPISASQASGI
jgi:hypothetical protein